ncbi:hypothetical protein DFP72DRAFT_912693, partial [Ephemerocybe angulata]
MASTPERLSNTILRSSRNTDQDKGLHDGKSDVIFLKPSQEVPAGGGDASFRDFPSPAPCPRCNGASKNLLDDGRAMFGEHESRYLEMEAAISQLRATVERQQDSIAELNGKLVSGLTTNVDAMAAKDTAAHRIFESLTAKQEAKLEAKDKQILEAFEQIGRLKEMPREEEGKTSALRRILENTGRKEEKRKLPFIAYQRDLTDPSTPNSPVPSSTKNPLYEALIKTWCFVGEPAPLQADLAGEKKVLAQDVPAPGQFKPTSDSLPQDQPRAPRRTKSMILQSGESGTMENRSPEAPASQAANSVKGAKHATREQDGQGRTVASSARRLRGGHSSSLKGQGVSKSTLTRGLDSAEDPEDVARRYEHQIAVLTDKLSECHAQLMAYSNARAPLNFQLGSAFGALAYHP